MLRYVKGFTVAKWQVRIDVRMTEVAFIGFSCLVFLLLQRRLLEGQPGRRVVGVLEIGPLDHHD